MVWVRVRRPPVLQSKLLCLSILYLLTTLPLAIYVSFSDANRRCLLLPFQTSPAAVKPLFEYPPGYGEHKHALTVPRALCSNPVVFPEYKTALEEINGLCRNLSMSPSASPDLRYQKGTRDTLAMEKCTGVVVASAILNDYDKIRQPKGLGSETLRTACFFMFIDDATHRVLASHGIVVTEDQPTGGVTTVGAWRVVRLRAGELPYENPAMNGVIVKHLLHRLFPNARFSVWVDAKMQLTVDPMLLVHSLLVDKNVDMAVSRHPFNLHTMEEAIATARWHKWGDVEAIRVQMETYCENGLQPWSPSKLPYPSDVPDTAIIIRRHGLASDLFSCLLFNELEAFNPRDQLAFAYVRDQMSPKVSINMFEVEVFEQVAIEYRHNLKRDGGGQGKQGVTRMASSRDIAGSSCERYLLKMWGEPTE
ncbi:hypothetical protein PR202_gb27082 [Eleusine coracana subsp. coracana]|uniref:TOD1/MUCI70 glycosyltransferase-like domain-containing protein n=1 Tax=Eleusine coracana subsp. coracana TaxID=191504 RepID=A0AAV5FTB1_ELECO|nr:hypothetical protein QOZ80_1AG0002260 [Eleusine coracana subsp. coracana]GJN38073.1 hypothetical protein PR202_gb27082 [Eleusine coracana subsp. coracana]